MNAETYYNSALRTANCLGREADRAHAVLGMTSEIGELADILKRSIAYGKPVDKVHFLEEAGDALWYIPLFVRSFGDLSANDFAMIVMSALGAQQDALADLENDERYQDLPAFHGDFTFLCGAVMALNELLAGGGTSDSLSLIVLMLCCLLYRQGLTLEEAMEKNIAKLQARYPEKFTADAALNRDLERERAALEGSDEAA